MNDWPSLAFETGYLMSELIYNFKYINSWDATEVITGFYELIPEMPRKL